MDSKRLRVGTKVKMLEGTDSNYYKKDQIGILVAGTCFHTGCEGPADSGGQYWMRGMPPTEEGHRANANGVCIGATSSFKVLKY